ncbi:hypothetical protein EDD21DRAFT_154275 [Dissophora ornata]|nr:hypothetical protein EDD21DRAFT_154275 [Dissophora ornata]
MGCFSCFSCFSKCIPRPVKKIYHVHFCEKEPENAVDVKLNKDFKSFTVTVFSIFGLVIAALNVLAINQTGVEDAKFKDLAYIISALLVVLGIVGLYSIHFPVERHPKNILVKFWVIAAVAVSALSIWEMDLLLTTEKAEAKGVCQRNLLIWDSNFNGDSGSVDPKALKKVVDECYLFVALAAAIELIFQVAATIFGIIIAVRYRMKVEDIEDPKNSNTTLTPGAPSESGVGVGGNGSKGRQAP